MRAYVYVNCFIPGLLLLEIRIAPGTTSAYYTFTIASRADITIIMELIIQGIEPIELNPEAIRGGGIREFIHGIRNALSSIGLHSQ